jgi:hypothetical protein
VKRRVIFQRSTGADPVVVRPRNVIVQWEAPNVVIKRDVKFLGTIRANPSEYVQRYGSSLKTAREFPDFVSEIKPPSGIVLAADYRYNPVHELEGDLEGLRLVDLDREGLSEYRDQLERLSIRYSASQSATSSTTYFGSNLASQYSSMINEIFDTIDRDRNGFVSVAEAQSLLLRLNSRLGRSYGENEARDLFRRFEFPHFKLKLGNHYDFIVFRFVLNSTNWVVNLKVQSI